jgi:hypothetical protein
LPDQRRRPTHSDNKSTYSAASSVGSVSANLLNLAVKDAKKKLEDSRQQGAVLEKKIDQLTQERQEKESRLAVLTRQNTELQATVRGLRGQLATAQVNGDASQIETILAESKGKMDDLQAELDKRIAELKRSKATIAVLNDQVADTNKTLETFVQAHEKVQLENKCRDTLISEILPALTSLAQASFILDAKVRALPDFETLKVDMKVVGKEIAAFDEKLDDDRVGLYEGLLKCYSKILESMQGLIAPSKLEHVTDFVVSYGFAKYWERPGVEASIQPLANWIRAREEEEGSDEEGSVDQLGDAMRSVGLQDGARSVVRSQPSQQFGSPLPAFLSPARGSGARLSMGGSELTEDAIHHVRYLFEFITGLIEGTAASPDDRVAFIQSKYVADPLMGGSPLVTPVKAGIDARFSISIPGTSPALKALIMSVNHFRDTLNAVFQKYNLDPATDTVETAFEKIKEESRAVFLHAEDMLEEVEHVKQVNALLEDRLNEATAEGDISMQLKFELERQQLDIQGLRQELRLEKEALDLTGLQLRSTKKINLELFEKVDLLAKEKDQLVERVTGLEIDLDNARVAIQREVDTARAAAIAEMRQLDMERQANDVRDDLLIRAHFCESIKVPVGEAVFQAAMSKTTQELVESSDIYRFRRMGPSVPSMIMMLQQLEPIFDRTNVIDLSPAQFVNYAFRGFEPEERSNGHVRPAVLRALLTYLNDEFRRDPEVTLTPLQVANKINELDKTVRR